VTESTPSHPSLPDTPRHRLVAILLVMGAAFAFTIIDAGAKWLSPRVGLVETIWLRYLSGFVLTALFLNPLTSPGVLSSGKPKLQFLRGALLMGATVFNFIALQHLQLAQTVSIGFLAPLTVSLLAGPILGEWAGPRRTVAIFVGFFGVLVITRPGFGAVHPVIVFSLMGMLSYAGVLLMTRWLSAADSPETTMFYSALFGAVALAPVAIPLWQTPQTVLDWVVIFLIGLGGAGGHWMLIQAQRRAEAPVLAPFLYTQVIWMTLSGYFIFGDIPDRWTVIGGSIVVASGLYLLHRERIRTLERRRQTP